MTAVEEALRELWAAQLNYYPTSVRLTAQEVIAWALDATVSRERQYQRLRAIAMALQDPVHVWYYIPGIGPGAVTGCRYGTDGPEYLSNFSGL